MRIIISTTSLLIKFCTTQNLTSKEGNQSHIKNTKGLHKEVLITAEMLYDVNSS